MAWEKRPFTMGGEVSIHVMETKNVQLHVTHFIKKDIWCVAVTVNKTGAGSYSLGAGTTESAAKASAVAFARSYLQGLVDEFQSTLGAGDKHDA